MLGNKLFCFNLLGGGNSDLFDVHRYLGKNSHFDSYFSKGLVQPPISLLVYLYMLAIEFKAGSAWTVQVTESR